MWLDEVVDYSCDHSKFEIKVGPDESHTVSYTIEEGTFRFHHIYRKVMAYARRYVFQEVPFHIFGLHDGLVDNSDAEAYLESLKYFYSSQDLTILNIKELSADERSTLIQE